MISQIANGIDADACCAVRVAENQSLERFRPQMDGEDEGCGFSLKGAEM